MHLAFFNTANEAGPDRFYEERREAGQRAWLPAQMNDINGINKFRQTKFSAMGDNRLRLLEKIL